MRVKAAVVLFSLIFFHLPVYSQSTIQTGYVRMLPDAGMSLPAGVSIFGLRSSTGVLVNETSIPAASTMQTGRIFVEVSGPVNTAVTLTNPSDSDAVVSFFFTDWSGKDFGNGTLTLAAKQQVSGFVTKAPFGLAVTPFTGTLTFNASRPVTATAMRNFVNQRSEVLMTNMPVSPVGEGFGARLLLFPDMSSQIPGTQIMVINPTDAKITGTLQFYGQGNSNRTAAVKVTWGGATNSSYNYTVAPRTALHMALQLRGAKVSYVKITPSGGSPAPSTVGLIHYQNNGVTTGVASFAALSQTLATRTYVESAGVAPAADAVDTGLAIGNITSKSLAVQLELMNFDGTPTGQSVTMSLPGNGLVTKFVEGLFPQMPASFKGVVRVSAPYGISVAAVRGKYNSRGDLLLTAPPVYDESSPSVSESYFPYIANGAGYSSQLILMSTGEAQTGSLLMTAQDGQAFSSTTLTAMAR